MYYFLKTLRTSRERENQQEGETGHISSHAHTTAKRANAQS